MSQIINGTWTETLARRRAAAAEPKTPEQLRPDPAVQRPLQPAVDVAALVASEVSKQMDGFVGRLEALFAPHTAQPAADQPPATSAQTAPPAAQTAPEAQNPPETPPAAENATQPA